MVALLVLLYGYYLTLQHASHFKAAEFWRTFFLVSFIEPFATSFVRLLVVKLTVAMLSFCLLGACRRRDAEDRLASWRGRSSARASRRRRRNLGLHMAALKDIRARPAARARARAPPQPHRRHSSQDERRAGERRRAAGRAPQRRQHSVGVGGGARRGARSR